MKINLPGFSLAFFMLSHNRSNTSTLSVAALEGHTASTPYETNEKSHACKASGPVLRFDCLI